MTSSAHARAGDRVAEAAASLEDDIVVMIQGDEPMITPGMIASAVAPMIADPSVTCVNLARRIVNWEEYVDRNTIKVVMDVHGDALHFCIYCNQAGVALSLICDGESRQKC
jgi:3-deoxy-manno-octulosonate cytidylyltransferase (CMP-KDO synthetase)